MRRQGLHGVLDRAPARRRRRGRAWRSSRAPDAAPPSTPRTRPARRAQGVAGRRRPVVAPRRRDANRRRSAAPSASSGSPARRARRFTCCMSRPGEEMEFLAAGKGRRQLEATPHHLTLSADGLPAAGNQAADEPAGARAEHRDGAVARPRAGRGRRARLRPRAPHAAKKRHKPYPESPSGMTGVQTLVPIMLDHVNAGRLTLAALRRPHQRRTGAHLRHRSARAASRPATTPTSPSST